MTISLCMIVRNEEQVLERILKCIQKFADEIIIVDTGSNDNTVEIAKKYTDNIYAFTWCNDFAKARNFSFSKATCDYIMWLDADDYITNENIEKLTNLKNETIDNSISVYMLKYVLFNKSGNRSIEFYRERILRKIDNFKWTGFVHEAISPTGNIKYLDIEIEHRKINYSQTTRNLDIYSNAMKKGVSFSLRDQYYYGRELFYNGKYIKAIAELKKYLKSNDTYTPNIRGAYIIIADIYASRKEYNKSLKTLFTCINRLTPTPEICCKIAYAFEKLQNTSQAIQWYIYALTSQIDYCGFNNIEYTKFIPYTELCRLYYNSSYETSKHFFLLAKNENPNHPTIKYNEQFFVK